MMHVVIVLLNFRMTTCIVYTMRFNTFEIGLIQGRSRSRAHIVYQRLANSDSWLSSYNAPILSIGAYVLGKILTETELKIINGVK